MYAAVEKVVLRFVNITVVWRYITVFHPESRYRCIELFFVIMSWLIVKENIVLR